jgi:hypothetical protein
VSDVRLAPPAAPRLGDVRGLTAVRASRCVRDALGAGLRAAVAGVLSRACHLAVEPDGALLVLAAPDVPLAPNGVTVGIAPAATMARAGFRAGQAVRLDPAGSPGPAEPGTEWLVRFDGTPSWEPRPTVRRMAPGVLDDRLQRVRAAVLAGGAGQSLLPLLRPVPQAAEEALSAAMVRLASAPARVLCEAAVAGDTPSVAGAAGRLAGLGPGLTPSGDDLLVGFTAAWTLIGEALGLDGARCRAVSGTLLAGARAGASALGRAWLAHAVRGELAEPMRRFADRLFAEDARELEPAVRGVLAVGASSGTDWAVGFVLGAGAALGGARRASP